MQTIARFFNNEAGGASIQNVILLIGILGISGIAVDGGNAYVNKRMMQATADSAAADALAG
jgi:Flp pilus assembly protein TadG